MVLKTLSTLGFGFLIFFGVATNKVLAHGSTINYQAKESIEIEAKFDNGTPMKNAQVVIYSPNNPTKAWLTSTTDENGKLIFTPDVSQQGNWSVKVRSAGHGSVINIPIKSASTKTDDIDTQEIVTSRSTPSPVNASLTTAQKLIMATTGVWGFVGTALFFSRKKD